MRLIDPMAGHLETHRCPADSRYRVVLDPAEASPDEPDNGTVALVYGPGDACTTYGRAIKTGELGGGAHALPPPVARWLEDITEYVEDFTTSACELAASSGMRP
ncbi:hypothetical protein NB700_001895 [Xanthomonas sacchari]|uniref:Uncharacterized protein n=1 Tax=Xanthomonas sacchari TaxID=56458 RepID=A0ABT3DUZ9_9XANT|nr:hypothetical protein [Xanthomonas sacchari]MCW0399339.1 hypothetical protein [Xanthomonas sacchari]